MIIDAQLHEPGPLLDWPEGDSEGRRRVMTEMLVAWTDAVGVDRVLLFPVDPDWGDYAVAAFPDRFASVPKVTSHDKTDRPDFDAEVDQLAGRAGVRGIRLIVGGPLTGENAKRLEDGVFDPVFPACQRHGLPLFIMASRWLHLLPRVVEANPELTIVVDHLGMPQPPIDDWDGAPWSKLDELLALAQYPNVMIKACGAPALSEAGPPYDDVWPHMRRIVDAFGPERLMWGSDIGRFHGRVGFDLVFPTGLGPYFGKHTYAQSLSLFRDTDQLTDEEKRLILGGTVQKLMDR